MDETAVATQHEELEAVAAACVAGLAHGHFDAAAGPYPAETMQTAWERAGAEAQGSR